MEHEIYQAVQAASEAAERAAKWALIGAKSVLTIDDVCLITNVSKQTIYMLTCKNKIPHYKPNGKMIFFDKGEVEAWLKRNRVQTTEEAETKSAAYNIKKGRLL